MSAACRLFTFIISTTVLSAIIAMMVYSNGGDTTNSHIRYWKLSLFWGMCRVRGLALMAKSIQALCRTNTHVLISSASLPALLPSLFPVDFWSIPAHLILFQTVVLHHLVSLFLESDDDESHEDVDEEEGEDHEVHHVKDGHLHPVPRARALVLIGRIHWMLQHPAEAEERTVKSWKRERKCAERGRACSGVLTAATPLPWTQWRGWVGPKPRCRSGNRTSSTPASAPSPRYHVHTPDTRPWSQIYHVISTTSINCCLRMVCFYTYCDM